jgi:hypothetical protein
LNFKRWCLISEKIAIAELQLGSNISLKVAELQVLPSRCVSPFFKLWNCDCGLKKKLRMPTSGEFCHAYFKGLVWQWITFNAYLLPEKSINNF